MLFNENTKIKLGYLGTVEGKGMYDNVRLEPQPIIDLYKDMEPDKRKEVDLNKEFFKVKDGITFYYFFARTNGVDIFTEIPLVENDGIFDWVRRDWGRAKTLWTQIKESYLTFSCTYYLETKAVQINVRWDGNHLGNKWVDNATNEDILRAINEWKKDFLADVNTISVA